MPFSIVIPTRDRPDGLRAAVASAIAALCDGGEVIVVDDGSKISASEVLSDFDDRELRIFRNPGPHGASAARNFGVLQTTTQTVFFLDDDDRLMPEYCCMVERDVLSDNSQIGFGFSTVTKKNLQGRPCGTLDASVPLRHCMAGLGEGFFVRRSIFLEIGGLDESIMVNEDTEFCIRLNRAGVVGWASGSQGVIFGDDTVREKSDRSSLTRLTSPGTRAAGFERIFERHGDFLRDHASVRRTFVFRILKYRLKERNYVKWRSFLSRYVPLRERFVLSLLGRVAFTIYLCVTN